MATATMAPGCLYCGLQLPDTTAFCPDCGRPIERGFEIRPIQESELDCLLAEIKRKDDLIRLQESELDSLRKEMKRKDDLLRQQGFSSNGNGPLPRMEESVANSRRFLRELTGNQFSAGS
jgi:predicted amidophosphoribosyltransferase